MTELSELEEATRRLKKDNLEKKRLITQLENEKKYLEERNRYLIEKLKQAGVIYEESAKRLLNFVETNIKPIKAKLDDFDTRLQKIKAYEASISSAIKRIDEFEVIIGNFKNEMIKNSEKQAEIIANINNLKKELNETSKRISKVQTFGSEELAEKVEEIKAKFGEDVRKVEDEFNILKIGVSNLIDNFKKEFERQSNALRNEMEKVDIKKAKELSEVLAHLTEELEKTKVDFAKEIDYTEKLIEKLDIKKTKEMKEALQMLSDNLEEKFNAFSGDLDKRVLTAEENLSKFRVELEKTLGKIKLETRDFITTKSKEFDNLLAEFKERMNKELENSSKEWDKKLGSLRTELLVLKGDVEKLIGVVNRKVEMGEERREKKLESSLNYINLQVTKKLEEEFEKIYGQIDEIAHNLDELKDEISKKEVKNEEKRKVELNKIIKDFALVKGEVDEKVREISSLIMKFSKISETLRQQILKESLQGVDDKVKAIISEMENKLEIVENGIVDKVAAMESEFDELKENFIVNVNRLKTDYEKKIDILRKQMENFEIKRNKENEILAKSVQKDIDARFSGIESNMQKYIEEMRIKIETIRKEVDNIAASLKQRFDVVIETKSKTFENMVASFVNEIKEKERGMNLAINEFKKEINQAELQKRKEIEKSLKEFIAKRGEIEEKLKQIDKKLDEFSQMRKELKKEIYVESVSGVNERVKEIVEGIEEKFETSKEENEKKISELINDVDVKIKEVEVSINKLRRDVDKITLKKSDEIDAIAEKLKADVEGRMKFTFSDIIKNIEAMKSEVYSIKTDFEKRLSLLKKEIEEGEAKRSEKIEKLKQNTEMVLGDIQNKFQIEEKGRWKEIHKGLKELMLVKGEINRRLKEIDDEIKKVYEIKDSLKNEITKETNILVESKLASFMKEEKGDMSELKKLLKTELGELLMMFRNLDERLNKINEKIRLLNEDIYEVKKMRPILLENVKSMNKIIEENVETRMKSVMKDFEKRIKEQERILDSRTKLLEKKINTISENIDKSKKEKEEELEEILKHVET
jgi:chromosome segregation ATPase